MTQAKYPIVRYLTQTPSSFVWGTPWVLVEAGEAALEEGGRRCPRARDVLVVTAAQAWVLPPQRTVLEEAA